MTTEVKICGLSTVADLDAAIAGSADYVGLVFFEPSPRNVALRQAQQLAEHARGRSKIVALTVNADDALLAEIANKIQPDVVQLHGSEGRERIAEVRRITNAKTLKVIKVATADDARDALAFKDVADRILFDAKAPADSPIPGGNGLQFDWHALEPVNGILDYMLSGGLNPENVKEAIRLTGTSAVDVSSGVEVRPGEKDPVRIRAFLEAAKSL
ncbi:MAG: phosphoribosylanthranilate isomerase [Pseudomonadota bacterium]